MSFPAPRRPRRSLDTFGDAEAARLADERVPLRWVDGYLRTHLSSAHRAVSWTS